MPAARCLKVAPPKRPWPCRRGSPIDAVFTDIHLAGALTGWMSPSSSAPFIRLLRLFTHQDLADRSRRVADSLFFNKPYDPAAVVHACRFNHSRAGTMHHYFLMSAMAMRARSILKGHFVDLTSAQAEATQGARELISQRVLSGTPRGLNRVFEIAVHRADCGNGGFRTPL
jgi:hypothetical protein